MPLLATMRSMSSQEWRALFRSLLLLPAVDISLRLRGYSATRSWLQGRLGKQGERLGISDDDQVALTVARAVDKAARRGPWPASCLRQALVLEHLLQKRGIATDLRIGVRRDEREKMAAHAWVERNGIVLIGGDEAATGHLPLP